MALGKLARKKGPEHVRPAHLYQRNKWNPTLSRAYSMRQLQHTLFQRYRRTTTPEPNSGPCAQSAFDAAVFAAFARAAAIFAFRSASVPWRFFMTTGTMNIATTKTAPLRNLHIRNKSVLRIT